MWQKEFDDRESSLSELEFEFPPELEPHAFSPFLAAPLVEDCEHSFSPHSFSFGPKGLYLGGRERGGTVQRLAHERKLSPLGPTQLITFSETYVPGGWQKTPNPGKNLGSMGGNDEVAGQKLKEKLKDGKGPKKRTFSQFCDFCQ
jgi:hypothetical protein